MLCRSAKENTSSLKPEALVKFSLDTKKGPDSLCIHQQLAILGIGRSGRCAPTGRPVCKTVRLLTLCKGIGKLTKPSMVKHMRYKTGPPTLLSEGESVCRAYSALLITSFLVLCLMIGDVYGSPIFPPTDKGVFVLADNRKVLDNSPIDYPLLL